MNVSPSEVFSFVGDTGGCLWSVWSIRVLIRSDNVFNAIADQTVVRFDSVLCILQVIRPETCSPCGKRIRFGKMAVKCRNCRVVAHPECKQKFTGGCLTVTTGSSAQQVPRELYEARTLGVSLELDQSRSRTEPESVLSDLCLHDETELQYLLLVQNSLEGFAPLVHPRVPQLVIDCVTEIERRGLDEVSSCPSIT